MVNKKKSRFFILKIILGVFLVVFFSSAVSAALCSAGDLILNLSSVSNAHGELWNAGNYPTGICFNDIFGYSYAGGNPHTCTATNLVLNLSSSTSAHGETPYNPSGVYTQGVCFGDLICHTETGGGTSCATGQLVVALSSATNAHIADKTNPDNYNYLVCCSASPPGDFSDAYWTNTEGQEIESGGPPAQAQADLGDTVGLGAIGTVGFLNGKAVVFDIYQGANLIDSLTTTGFNIAQFNIDAAYIAWKTNKTTSGNPYKFTVRHGTKTRDSGELNVGDADDDPLTIVLTNPKSCDISELNQKVNFSQASTDTDDVLSVVWNFGDGSLTESYNKCNKGISSWSCDTTHKYSATGQYIAKLIVKDTRGNSAEKRIDVLIAGKDSNSSCAHISDPPWGSTKGSGHVLFNSSGTYGVECYEFACTNPGSGIGQCMNSNTYPRLLAESFNCTKLNPVTALNLSWRFDDGESLKGSWNEFRLHKKLYSTGGKHSGVLKTIFI